MSNPINDPVTFHSDDPAADLAELVHIVLNLRHHSIKWSYDYGEANKRNKKRWELRLDKWLGEHIKIPMKDLAAPPRESKSLKIEKKK